MWKSFGGTKVWIRVEVVVAFHCLVVVVVVIVGGVQHCSRTRKRQNTRKEGVVPNQHSKGTLRERQRR
jgi:hypothetical protein